MMKAKLKPLLRACTAFTCATVLMASPVLVSAGDSVSDLEQETQNLQSELQDLNEQLSSISGEITSLASKIESTNKEAEQAELDLAAAQVNEDLQYQSMKKRIQYIYENGNVSFLEILFTSDSMGEFLNRVDFVERVTDYDRKMLKELQDLRQDIDQKEKNLKKQKEELDAMKQEMTSKQSELNSRISSTSGQLSASSQALAKAKAAEEAAKKALETTTDSYHAAGTEELASNHSSDKNSGKNQSSSDQKQESSSQKPEDHKNHPEAALLEVQTTATITTRAIPGHRNRAQADRQHRSLLLLPRRQTLSCLRLFWNVRQVLAAMMGCLLLPPSL